MINGKGFILGQDQLGIVGPRCWYTYVEQIGDMMHCPFFSSDI